MPSRVCILMFVMLTDNVSTSFGRDRAKTRDMQSESRSSTCERVIEDIRDTIHDKDKPSSPEEEAYCCKSSLQGRFPVLGVQTALLCRTDSGGQEA